MKILNFKDFMKKYNLKINTMNESELQRVYNYPIYPRIRKYIQIEDLIISVTEAWEDPIGLVL